jgi:DNA-directed RNA polymerase omega subunit
MALALSRTSLQEVDIEKCVNNIGNRNDMIVIASARAKELQRKHKASGDSKHCSFTVDALLDIQYGVIDKDYVYNKAD